MNENESTDVFQKIGGRKFLITFLGIGSLVVMASFNPLAVTTDVVLGIVGLVATFSGANSVVTAILSKNKPVEPEAPSLTEPAPYSQAQVPSQVETGPSLESRVQALEEATNSFIEILKAQNDTLNRLTMVQNKVTLSKQGQNNERQD